MTILHKFIIYLPGVYWVKTRQNNLRLFLSSFVYQQIVPFLIFYSVVSDNKSAIQNLIIVIISYLVFITFYEIGYIYNDFLAASKESKPTIRKSDLDLKDKNKFILIHTLFGTLFLIILFSLLNPWNYILFHLTLIITLLVFVWHNIINAKYRFLTMGLLYLGKYTILYLGIINLSNFNIIFLDAIIFNLISSIIAAVYYYEHKYKDNEFIMTNLIKILYILPLLIFINNSKNFYLSILFALYVFSNFFSHNYKDKYK